MYNMCINVYRIFNIAYMNKIFLRNDIDNKKKKSGKCMFATLIFSSSGSLRLLKVKGLVLSEQ